MTPIDPLEAANAGRTAAGHGEIFLELLPGILISGFIGTLLIVKDILSIKTWKGKLWAYISKVTVGAGSAYFSMLAIPMLGIPFASMAQMQQLVGIAAFVIGMDAVDVITTRIFGLKKNKEEKAVEGKENE